MITNLTGLIDGFTLLIHPLVLGRGRTLFDRDPIGLDLVRAEPTGTGVILTTYRPAAGA